MPANAKHTDNSVPNNSGAMWHPHPLLCLYRTPTQPMRRFLSEILSQEGYACVDDLDLDALDDPASVLQGRALAFISAESLTQQECNAIGGWVRGGGAAILILPPVQLIQSLGLHLSEAIHDTYHTMPPGYARFLSSTLGLGITPTQ